MTNTNECILNHVKKEKEKALIDPNYASLNPIYSPPKVDWKKMRAVLKRTKTKLEKE